MKTTRSESRRGFLGALGAAGFLGWGRALHASEASRVQEIESWLSGLTARQHRMVFDVHELRNGRPLMQARGLLDAYRDAYRTQDSDVGVILIVHGNALPLVASHDLWEQFRLGEASNVDDAETGKPALRNPYTAGSEKGALPASATIDALQVRGVRFALCRNTLARVAGELAASAGAHPDETRAVLTAGLLPGVHLVPAALVALSRAQEEGFSYFYAG